MSILKSTLNFFSFIPMFFMRILLKSKNIISKPESDNEWAVVTGASDGIGKEFAISLSKLGYNIVALGRSNQKLELLKKEIKTQLKIMQVDFTQTDDKFYGNLINLIKDKHVTVLINNVGFSYDYPKQFLANSRDFYENMIECNVKTMVNMTHLLAAKATDTKLNIINMSSVLGEIPAPFLSVYGATKAFVKKFSDDFKLELTMNPKSKINVSVISPWLVSTNMSKTKPSLFSPHAANYVKELLKVGRYIPHDCLTLISITPILNKILFKLIQQKINSIKDKKQNQKYKEITKTKENSQETINKTKEEHVNKNVVQTPEDIPEDSPVDSPIDSPVDSPEESPEESPVKEITKQIATKTKEVVDETKNSVKNVVNNVVNDNATKVKEVAEERIQEAINNAIENTKTVTEKLKNPLGGVLNNTKNVVGGFINI